MKPIRYIIACIITVSICVALYLSSAQKVAECESILQNKERAILELTERVDIITTVNTDLTAQLDELTVQLWQMQTQLDRKQDKMDRGWERGTRRIMEVTAYWEGSCGKAPDHPLYGITASGKRVQDGFVAAGPELAIGQKVYMPYFDKVFTVMDRGSAITNGHLDIYMTTYKDCMEFGRRELEVWLVE